MLISEKKMKDLQSATKDSTLDTKKQLKSKGSRKKQIIKFRAGTDENNNKKDNQFKNPFVKKINKNYKLPDRLPK